MNLKKKLGHFSVNDGFKYYSITLGSLIGVFILTIIILATTYLIRPSQALVTAIFVIALIMTFFTATGAVIYYFLIKNVYLEEMFKKTNYNYEMLAKQKKQLALYNEDGGSEFKQLNEYIKEMNAVFANVDLINDPLDYSKYNLEYPDPSNPKLITSECMVSNMRNFILSSQTFRNGLLFFAIEEEKENITDNDYKSLIAVIEKYITLPNTIYAISYNRGGVMVFCPDIDSVSYFKEAIKKVIDESLIYNYTATGVDIVKVRGAMVIYPYSNIDDVLTDLRYADRQGKSINIYLPDRLNENDNMFSHETLIMNNMTKIFLEFSKIDVGQKEQSEAIRRACLLMKNVRVNLGFENVGTIMFEPFTNKYYCTFNDSDDPKQGVFEKDAPIKNEFIEALVDTVDEDYSYYFSKRELASDKIGAYLDTFGIRSGNFFVIMNNGRMRGVVYFLNTTKDAKLNNYSREMLFVFSTYLAHFSRELQDKKFLDTANMRVRDLLRLTEIDMYTIVKETHKLMFVSPALSDAIGGVTEGGTCYKTLFGRDAPCENCPLNSYRKMKANMNGTDCVISNVLLRRKSLYTTLVVEHDKNQYYDTNRFHHDLQIFSAYSLSDRLNYLYKSGVRGTLILLHVDNWEALINQYGQDGYFFRLKRYIDILHEGLKNQFSVYAYDNDTLAIIFNEEGRIDVVSSIEQMYNLSNEILISDEGIYSINPTFIAFDFPLDNPSPTDFARWVERYLKDNKDIYNQNLLVIASSNYRRSADREQFVLESLRAAYRNKSLVIKYLPIINYDDKNIVGAEMLMRLSDTYLNVGISAYEFIKVAKKYGHIGHISNYLIDTLGKIYQKYGVTPFKTAGFRHFTLNTDVTFLKDENFLKSMNELQQTYHLPKDFITFEVEEKDIAENYDFYKTMARRILSNDIVLAADDYTGENVSLETCKELGFNYVKVARRVVSKIDTDVEKFNEIKRGLIDCDELGIKACLVGIENKDQHGLLSDYDLKFYRQGYYYGEPCDIDVLMDKLKQNFNK